VPRKAEFLLDNQQEDAGTANRREERMSRGTGGRKGRASRLTQRVGKKTGRRRE